MTKRVTRRVSLPPGMFIIAGPGNTMAGGMATEVINAIQTVG
jgi:hypothetical protein